jgi:hypothetical protein
MAYFVSVAGVAAAAVGSGRRRTFSFTRCQRLAGQDEVALLEHVVGVELGDRGDLDPLDVPRRAV